MPEPQTERPGRAAPPVVLEEVRARMAALGQAPFLEGGELEGPGQRQDVTGYADVGATFAFRWNVFPGSHRSFTATSRSSFVEP